MTDQEFVDAFVTFDPEMFAFVSGAILTFFALGFGVGLMIRMIKQAR